MNLFTYHAAKDLGGALGEHGDSAAYLAGGTNLLDDMKLGVESHAKLVDVNRISGLDKIERHGEFLRVGATVRNSTMAYDGAVKSGFPALSEAILSGASPQLRNKATTAGNLLQRTRCYYFRDPFSACNKRQPGSGCSAIGGYNRIHAILGTSDQCIATHPSDMDVALVAFEAVVNVEGKGGKRTIPIAEFYVSYGDDPAKETTLMPGELITSVDVPLKPWFRRSHYMKARDRASYEFSLSSAAVALDISGGAIRDARVALGGVATKPWRATAAEAALKGNAPTEDVFRAAAEAELAAARPQAFNGFKVELCKRVIAQALKVVANM